jgi:hypothetical protein
LSAADWLIIHLRVVSALLVIYLPPLPAISRCNVKFPVATILDVCLRAWEVGRKTFCLSALMFNMGGEMLMKVPRQDLKHIFNFHLLSRNMRVRFDIATE